MGLHLSFGVGPIRYSQSLSPRRRGRYRAASRPVYVTPPTQAELRTRAERQQREREAAERRRAELMRRVELKRRQEREGRVERLVNARALLGDEAGLEWRLGIMDHNERNWLRACTAGSVLAVLGFLALVLGGHVVLALLALVPLWFASTYTVGMIGKRWFRFRHGHTFRTLGE